MRICRAIALVYFALLPETLLAQVLNMSHDLVSLGIAAQNITPNNPSLDARPLIQAAVSYVQSHPVQTLTLDTGSYYLLSNTQGNAVLIFPNLSNMTIDLAGSTIYFTGPQLPNGLQLFYCSNVTLKNFQIDYIHPPYTHVQLTSVDSVNRLLHYQTLPGWPDPTILYNQSNQSQVEGYWIAIFRNGSIVPGTSRTLVAGSFTNNTIAVTDGFPWAQSATLATLQAGDTVVLTVRGRGPPLLVWECNGVTLSQVTVFGSPTWAVDLFQPTNTTVDSVRIMPRPGSGLIGSNADGIHFNMMGPNNHIRNCYVTRTMDDALIMDNQWAAVVTSQPGTRELLVKRNTYVRFANGTMVNFVDRGTTLESAGATILTQNPADSPQLAFEGTVDLTFDRDLPSLAANTIMAFGSPAARGQGSTIEDNTVEDVYGGRGVWLSGVEGVTVARNVVRRASNAGIVAASSTESVVDPGDSSPPAHDIIITDNALEGELGPEAAGTGLQSALAGLQVVTVSDPFFVFATTPSNTNFTIANNYIADSGMSGIWIGELTGGTLQNNLVIRSSRNPTLNGTAGIPSQLAAQVMQDALLPVVTRYSSSVTETGDTVSATSGVTAPVTMNPPGSTTTKAAATTSFTLQTAVNGFAWKAVSDSPWLTVNSGPLGAGSGTIQFSAAVNNTGVTRTGNIVVAGETFKVAQTSVAALACDVDGDQTSTIADVQVLINEVLGAVPATHDVNGDGVVNVADVQKIVAAVLSGNCQ